MLAAILTCQSERMTAYQRLDGSKTSFDLDAVVDVIDGRSGIRPSWSALIVFVLATGAFVELRSSPPDYRGNSDSEAFEVEDGYLTSSFGLAADQIAAIRAKPKKWKFRSSKR